jgi:hypothetical protein
MPRRLRPHLRPLLLALLGVLLVHAFPEAGAARSSALALWGAGAWLLLSLRPMPMLP